MDFSPVLNDYQTTTSITNYLLVTMSSIDECKAMLLAAQEARKEVEWQWEAELVWELVELEELEWRVEEERQWEEQQRIEEEK